MSRTPNTAPSTANLRVLAAIVMLTSDGGAAPSISDVAKHLGITKTAVRVHCEVLASYGLTTQTHGTVRHWIATADGRRRARRVAVA